MGDIVRIFKQARALDARIAEQDARANELRCPIDDVPVKINSRGQKSCPNHGVIN